jgi:hypothetical protein
MGAKLHITGEGRAKERLFDESKEGRAITCNLFIDKLRHINIIGWVDNVIGSTHPQRFIIAEVISKDSRVFNWVKQSPFLPPLAHSRAVSSELGQFSTVESIMDVVGKNEMSMVKIIVCLSLSLTLLYVAVCVSTEWQPQLFHIHINSSHSHKTTLTSFSRRFYSLIGIMFSLALSLYVYEVIKGGRAFNVI